MRQIMITLTLSLLLSGCADTGSVSTKTESSDDKPKVSTTVPADFPVPVYSGFKVISVDPGHRVNSGAMQVSIATETEPIKDSPATIGAFYTQKLQQSGWQIEEHSAAMQGPDQSYVSAQKGNERVTVSISNHVNFEPPTTSVEMSKYTNPPGQ